MKIEKINNYQIKFVLTQDDLKERDLELNDLVFGSGKSQALFKDIMNQAFHECDFDIENTPVMIEATPLSPDGIMIIVTKVNEDFEVEQASSLLPKAKSKRKFKTGEIEIPGEEKSSVSIYSFDTINNVSKACERLSLMLDTESSLIKMNNLYYLVMDLEEVGMPNKTKDLEDFYYDRGLMQVAQRINRRPRGLAELFSLQDSFNNESSEEENNTTANAEETKEMQEVKNRNRNIHSVISEYGTRQMSTLLAKYYLMEHGEIMVKSDAINIMGNL